MNKVKLIMDLCKLHDLSPTEYVDLRDALKKRLPPDPRELARLELARWMAAQKDQMALDTFLKGFPPPTRWGRFKAWCERRVPFLCVLGAIAAGWLFALVWVYLL